MTLKLIIKKYKSLYIERERQGFRLDNVVIEISDI